MEESKLLYVSVGAVLALMVMVFVSLVYILCCKSTLRKSPEIVSATVDLEMARVNAAAARPESKPSLHSVSPSLPTSPPPPPSVAAAVLPSLSSILHEASSPFPVLSKYPPSQFESNWSQGVIVDVWGTTLTRHAVPLNDSLNFSRLHLLRIASGCVSGVEKMYFCAKHGNSSAPGLGMVEMSVDLNTKRLSAVFKLSQGPEMPLQVRNEYYALFDAFKRLVDEEG